VDTHAAEIAPHPLFEERSCVGSQRLPGLLGDGGRRLDVDISRRRTRRPFSLDLLLTLVTVQRHTPATASSTTGTQSLNTVFRDAPCRRGVGQLPVRRPHDGGGHSVRLALVLVVRSADLQFGSNAVRDYPLDRLVPSC
jgi:hypothetical protein